MTQSTEKAVSLQRLNLRYYRCGDGGSPGIGSWFPFDKFRAGLESVYEEALAHEFDLRNISYERQAQLAVRYKSIAAGNFRADFPSTSSGEAWSATKLWSS